MEFPWVGEQSAYFHGTCHGVFRILALWDRPHIILSSGMTWVWDTQKYHIKIQRHFCIGLLLNPLNIGNIEVSNVLLGLSPLCVHNSGHDSQKRCAVDRGKQGRHSVGKPETGALSTLVSKALETDTSDPHWLLRVWIDLPDATFQGLWDEASAL